MTSTRMSSKMEVFDAKLSAVESSLKTQEALVSSHDTILKEHSGLLIEITKTLAVMRMEMREGFQQQVRWDRGKDKVGLSTGGSSGASFELIEDCNQHSSDRRLGKSEFQLEDFWLAAKKVELPTFNGEDPYGWISRAEFYFTVQEVPSELQIQLAQLCMEGMPWHWFKMLKEEDPSLDWERFKHAFFDRYGNQHIGNLFLQLKMIQQEASLDEFVKEFEMLASQILGITDE